MTLTFLQIITFALASILFVMTPGPGIFAVIAKAMSQGAKSVLPLAVGIALSDIVYVVLSVYGLSALATHFHEAFVVVRVVGAAYLFYLAYKMWTATPTNNETVVKPAGKRVAFGALVGGFLISFSNPKVILFYIALLPSFFPVATLNVVDTMIISGMTFISVVIGLMAYAVLAGYARKQLKKPQTQRRFNRISATLMGGAGTWLLVKN